MAERVESGGTPEIFSGFPEVLQQFVAGQLPLNRIQESTRVRVSVESDASTWVSSTRREGEKIRLRIGEQKIPGPIAKQFRWGARTVEEQYAVKVAHEYAHVLQEKFDSHLLRWLDGADDIPEDAIPYIQLYATLSSIGGLHGLSQMDVYHQQSRTTGNLSVPVYEDMAETIASYLLGNEYFLYRLANTHGSLTQEQAEELVDHVTKVVAIWQRDSSAT